MNSSDDPIRGARRAPLWSWPVLAIVLVAGTVFLNQVFFPGRSWRPLWETSGGWVHPTLLGGLMVLATGLLVICAGAGLRPGDLGLQMRRLPTAILYTAVAWGLAQVLVTGWGVLLEGRPRLHDRWAEPGIPGGSLLGQLLGNALMEEVLYRGFVFTQLVLLFGGKGRVSRARLGLVALAASLVFALSHVPNRLMKGTYGGLLDIAADQAMLVASGTLLALVYWRTRNLPFVIGVHSLTNRPSMVYEVPEGVALPPEAAVFLGGLSLALLWPRLPFTGRAPA